MSAGSKKRKHHDSTTEQPAKVRVVEKPAKEEKSTSNEKSRGQSRQAKSERRSKKVTKGTALLSRSQDLTQEPELLAHNATPQKEDDLANGQDFVSLSADPVTAPSPSIPKSQGKTAPAQKSQKKTKNQPPTETILPAPTSTDKSKKDRFILFIGNLPYAATTSSITNHFIALQPFTVRHSTDKTTRRSKGFAFLEFEHFDKMKTCLKLYHHSMFDPENQPNPKAEEADEDERDTQTKPRKNAPTKPNSKTSVATPQKLSKSARRINVELTAGGGGKSQQRKDRIHDKNKKLSEERERRHVKELEEKTKAELKGGKGRKERLRTGANADADEGEFKGEERGNIHPSRLARVPMRR